MKRFSFLLLVALCVSGSALAQKGVSSIGVFVSGQTAPDGWLAGYHGIRRNDGTYDEGNYLNYTDEPSEFAFGVGVRYQYGLTKHFRIEPSVVLYFPKESTMQTQKYWENLEGAAGVFRGGTVMETLDVKQKNAFSCLLNVNMHYFLGNFRVVRPYVLLGVTAACQSVYEEAHGWYEAGTYRAVETERGTYANGVPYSIDTYYDKPYDALDETWVEVDENKWTLGGNAGVGCDFRLSSEFTLQVEAKALYANRLAFLANVGVTYNF